MMDIFLHIARTGGTTLNTTLRWVYCPTVCRRIPSGRPDEAYRWLEEKEEPLRSEFQLPMGHTHTRYLGWLCICSIYQILIPGQGSDCLVGVAVELFFQFGFFQFGERLV